LGTSKKRIGFLNFEEIHHIPHFIGIANELSKFDDYQIDILTYKGTHDYLYKLMDLLDVKNIQVIKYDIAKPKKLIDSLTKRKKPSSVFLFKKNKKKLLKYDALVFTDKNHKYIYKKRKDNKTPYLICVNHGAAGGRGYSFRKIVKLFDLNLIGGSFYLNRLKKEGVLVKNHKVIGYSKFDIVTKENQNVVLFNNKKPVVFYNPHFNKDSSSWYKYGLQILEYFYNSSEFNLIFAPHIYLFNRKGFETPSVINEKYFNKENIHIDLGSIRSSNMTYTLNSDIYLGDVSSQISEFHIKPRPSIFINTNNVDWKSNVNYRSWHTGNVIESISELDNALNNLDDNIESYLSLQKKLFDENYYTDEQETASEKGAKAINNFLTENL
jgi:hypothetical protein